LSANVLFVADFICCEDSNRWCKISRSIYSQAISMQQLEPQQQEQQQPPEIAIKAAARKNAQFLTVLGAAGLLICMLAANFWWDSARLVLVLLILVSFLVMLVGVFKHFEPQDSFILSPSALQHFHRHGNWLVNWDNIMLIAQPKVTVGIESKELNYIGIKLRDLSLLSGAISPRLANRLLHEQRDLHVLRCKQTGVSVFEGILNDNPYKTTAGKKVTGPVAAWLHRTEQLREALGYDLYIPLNASDRSPDEFIALLKQCKAAAGDYEILYTKNK
jgi:hypothetical protein